MSEKPTPQSDIDLWFTYHPPKPEQIPVFEKIRDAGFMFAETIVDSIPESPDRDLAVLRIREAVMLANASLACYPEGKS